MSKGRQGSWLFRVCTHLLLDRSFCRSRALWRKRKRSSVPIFPLQQVCLPSPPPANTVTEIVAEMSAQIPFPPTFAPQYCCQLPAGHCSGGANDGKWHGPAKGFGLNVGKGSFLAPGDTQGVIWIDDIEGVLVPTRDP